MHLCKVKRNTNDVEINWSHYYSKLYPFTTEQWFSWGFNAINYDLWVHEDHQTILWNYHNCWIVYHTQSMPLQWILLGGLGVYMWSTHEVDMRLLFPISMRLVRLSTHSNELALLWTKWFQVETQTLCYLRSTSTCPGRTGVFGSSGHDAGRVLHSMSVHLEGRFHCESTFLGSQTAGLPQLINYQP